jgi:hypothetical protein
MTDKWIEGKAAAAAYQVSLRDFKKARLAVQSMGKYAVDTDEISEIRAQTLLNLQEQLGTNKDVALEALQPLIAALKGAEPTSEAKNMLLG